MPGRPAFPDMPESEHRHRVTEARSWMAENGTACVVVASDENIAYYTGFRRTFLSPLHWFQAAVIGREQVTFVIPDHNHNTVANLGWVSDLRCWGGPDPSVEGNPIKVLLGVVREMTPNGGRVGVELGEGMHWQASVGQINEFQAGLQGFEILDVAPEIWRQRMVKSRYELQLLTECAQVACRGFMAGLKAVRAGVSERDVLKAVMTEFVASGAADSPFQGQLMIRSGHDRYPMYAARAEDRILRDGDQLILDSGPSYHGYLIDMQRQACIGPPSELQQRLYNRGVVGFRAALAAIRPGAITRDIHKAAVDAMNDHGPPLESHIAFFGHGIGLANHEPPWLRWQGDEVLQEGMALSVEIPSYDIPRFRVLGGFLEDVVVVTADGHRNLTAEVPHELWLA